VLLNLGRRRVMRDMLPTPLLFDHVIVRATVQGRDYWLDATRLGQHGHLARMGETHEGNEVLVIAPGVTGATTISTPDIADLVRNEVSETAEIAKFDGDATFKVRQVWTGAAAESVRVLFERLQGPRLSKVFADALDTRYPGARITAGPQIDDDRDNNLIVANTTYSVPGLASEREGNWIVRFTPANLAGALATPPSSVRTTPLGVLRFPFEAKYTIEVKFPDNVSELSDPIVTTKQDPFFAYTVEETFRGNVAKTTFGLRTLAAEVPPADIKTYAQDLQVLSNVRSAIFVPKGAIKTDPGAPGGGDLVDLLKSRLNEAADKLTETIGSGKLTGRDLAEPYCRRAEVYSDLGRAEDARRDAAAALKFAPSSGKSFVCRAYVEFNAGEFGKAVDDFTSAIAFGATDPHTFYMRGLASFYAGDLDDAAADFGKSSAASDNTTRLYTDLWLTWTLQRLGRPVPEDVTVRASADPRGDWPRPALAMVNGILAPEEMLKLLDAKSGDEARETLAEAYFYLGERYLALGDKLKAREWFEKTRALNVIIYTEHVAAGFELKKLADGARTLKSEQ
jgi:lipoprotein NlpI